MDRLGDVVWRVKAMLTTDDVGLGDIDIGEPSIGNEGFISG